MIKEQIKALQTQKKITEKEIDKVLSKRSTGSRARAAYELWLRLNPLHRISYSDGTIGYRRAKEIHEETVDKVKFLKKMQKNEFGTNESGTMRLGLELPPHAARFISMFHPDIFDDDKAAKTRFRKLIKEFKEFQVMERV